MEDLKEFIIQTKVDFQTNMFDLDLYLNSAKVSRRYALIHSFIAIVLLGSVGILLNVHYGDDFPLWVIVVGVVTLEFVILRLGDLSTTSSKIISKVLPNNIEYSKVNLRADYEELAKRNSELNVSFVLSDSHYANISESQFIYLFGWAPWYCVLSYGIFYGDFEANYLAKCSGSLRKRQLEMIEIFESTFPGFNRCDRSHLRDIILFFLSEGLIHYSVLEGLLQLNLSETSKSEGKQGNT